jgi:hypothetical protein
VANDRRIQSEERRRYPRAVVSTAAVVLARANDGVRFTIESISIGGARIRGPLTLSANERLQILFEVDDHPVDVRAQVICVVERTFERDVVLVRFIDVADDARARIREMVRRAIELADADG